MSVTAVILSPSVTALPQIPALIPSGEVMYPSISVFPCEYRELPERRRTVKSKSSCVQIAVVTTLFPAVVMHKGCPTLKRSSLKCPRYNEIHFAAAHESLYGSRSSAADSVFVY